MSDQATPSSNVLHNEDWDKSLSESNISSLALAENSSISTQSDAPTLQNTVAFPASSGESDMTSGQNSAGWNGSSPGQGKRTLSELLKLHAEKGTDCHLSAEEAARLGDVLGQWINASSSPYEGEDDFFKSHDDIDLPPRHGLTNGGRPRGQSECMGSRPSSTAGFSAT
ncbi:hypothetical protein AN958_00430 [Leucoagaricus sp. SymC.cos]|nr:hypothetical protein AN958_00430 [Leucoagaricus sp. SymC.cos]